jgi:hypothetical protein
MRPDRRETHFRAPWSLVFGPERPAFRRIPAVGPQRRIPQSGLIAAQLGRGGGHP